MESAFIKKAYYLSRRRNCRQIAGYILRSCATRLSNFSRLEPVVRIWPPFQLPLDEVHFIRLRQFLSFYLGKHSPRVEHFVQAGSPEMQRVARFASNECGPLGEINVSEAKNILRQARFRLIWRSGKVAPLPLRPFDYIVDENAGVFTANEWSRLCSNVMRMNSTPEAALFISPAERFASCAVLGTGPSAELFMREAEKFDTWIGANAIVLDKDLWSKHPPYAVCMMDPYVFSPASSMRCLLEHLFDLLETTGSKFITTSEFAPLIQVLFPQHLRSKCLFVQSVGFDCIRKRWGRAGKSLKISRYGNVLCDLMLPLAASLAKRVVLFGCDGRPASANGNFPKAAKFQAQEDAAAKELAYVFDTRFYETEFPRTDFHTRVIVDQCQKMGTNLFLRKPSFNQGLAHLPIIE